MRKFIVVVIFILLMTLTLPVYSQTQKSKALALVKEINDWIVEVSKKNPGKDTHSNDHDRFVAILNSEWAAKFGTRPNDMANALGVKDLGISCLGSRNVGVPENTIALRKNCADKIEAAANKLRGK